MYATLCLTHPSPSWWNWAVCGRWFDATLRATIVLAVCESCSSLAVSAIYGQGLETVFNILHQVSSVFEIWGSNIKHLTCSKMYYICMYICIYNVRTCKAKFVQKRTTCADGVDPRVCTFSFGLSFVTREFSCWKWSTCVRVCVCVCVCLGFVSGCDYVREHCGYYPTPLSFNARTPVYAAETQIFYRRAACYWRWRRCDWSPTVYRQAF